ncbi:MAG: hypothetical protein NC113_06530 [Bacteroides sp.]|nr:hypothetical protein [Bacteroides sp.]MCM1447861.1 hypothetical protein [Bacteroides sp.]
MKKNLLSILLLVLLCAVPLCAQDDSEHAAFLGISLGGDYDDFLDSLESRGYDVQTIADTHASLTGMFDGVRCIIEVHRTPKTGVVYQVSVSFVEFMENEVARMLKYRQIKKALKKKYASWDYRREQALDEWSSVYARISLGTRRLPGHGYKTLYVWWQDRAGWEALNRETGE